MHSLETIRDYYGRVLQSNKDLKTSACCAADAMPPHLAAMVRQIHPEVLDRFYGCGSPLPLALEGCTVLDLGSGSGRDCFMLSKLVGPKGRVIGVDMTPEQLAVARRHLDYHARLWGHAKSNVIFVEGYIEDLEAAGVAANSIDVVVSNCVVNLSPDKERVLGEIFRVLKPGGELFFSDVFADRRLPQPLAMDPVLLGECLGGALYVEDFRRMVQRLGCADHRVLSSTPLAIQDPESAAKVGSIQFTSQTVRAFKLGLEDRCEDFGQVAWYLGSIPESLHAFQLDDHHIFETGRPMPVCGNTAAMLKDTRYAPHFRIDGDRRTHFGLFRCGPAIATVAATSKSSCC